MVYLDEVNSCMTATKLSVIRHCQEKSRAEQPFLTEANKLQKLVRSGSLSNQIAKMSYFKP